MPNLTQLYLIQMEACMFMSTWTYALSNSFMRIMVTSIALFVSRLRLYLHITLCQPHEYVSSVYFFFLFVCMFFFLFFPHSFLWNEHCFWLNRHTANDMVGLYMYMCMFWRGDKSKGHGWQPLWSTTMTLFLSPKVTMLAIMIVILYISLSPLSLSLSLSPLLLSPSPTYIHT